MSSAISSVNQLIGQYYTAKQQQQTADKALAQEERYRKPFDKVAQDVSKRLRNLDDIFADSPLLQQAVGRMRTLLQPGGLAKAGSQFVTDYLEGTQEVADLDRSRLEEGIVSRFGAQYGQRAGSEIPEAAGRAGAEFLARRHAAAQALQLPGASLEGNLPLAYGSFAMNQELEPLRLAANFGSQQATSPSPAGFSQASPIGSALIGSGAQASAMGNLTQEYIQGREEGSIGGETGMPAWQWWLTS